MMYVIAFLSATLTLFLVRSVWRKSDPLLKPFFLPALFLHLIAGIALGLLYVYHYGESDTLIYFQEGLKLNKLLFSDPQQYLSFIWSTSRNHSLLQMLVYTDLRALFMVKTCSIILLLSMENYWIASAYFSIISFLACWKILSTLHRYFPESRLAALFSFLFIPSVVFWSSGIVKESIALASLLCIVNYFVLFYKTKKLRWHQWLSSLICLWVLYNIKYYYLAVAIPVIITSIVTQFIISKWHIRSFIQEVAVWLFFFFAISLLVTQIHPNFYPSRFLSVILSNYHAFIANSAPQDVMHFRYLSENWVNVTLISPWAFISGVFRPFLWESTNVLQAVAAVENTLILVLTLCSLKSLRSIPKHQDRLLIFATLIYCFVLCVFLTLSTPNFGTLIRYRVGFLPLFIFLTTNSSPIFSILNKFFSRG